MANFNGLVLTNAGRDIQSKAQAGAPLVFTRIAIGDGNEPADINVLTALASEQKSLTISNIVALGSGQAKVKTTLSNENIGIGFYFREIGLFAQDPDTSTEYLYAYTHSGDAGDYLPAGGGSTVIEQELNLITVVGSATNLTAIIDSSLLYATQSDLEDLANQVSQKTSISLEGPSLIYPGSSNEYTITDFSDFSAYSAVATVGTPVLNGRTLTLDIAPGETASGTVLTIDRDAGQQTFNIAVGSQSVGKPTIQSPINGATGTGDTPTISTGAFVSFPSGEFTHDSSDYQIATDSGFANIVWQSLNDASNLLFVQLAAGVLEVSTQYYVRVRHHGDNGTGGTNSAWSDVVSFTTAASFYLANELAKLSWSTGVNGESLGGAVDVSAAGDVIIVGAKQTDAADVSVAGSASIFQLQNGSYTQIERIMLGSPVYCDYFGSAVAISADGKTAAISAMSRGSTPDRAAVYIYTSAGGFWTPIAVLKPDNPQFYTEFGASVAISSDGSTVVVGAPEDDVNGSNAGVAYIFSNDGGWHLDQKIYSDDIAQAYFGAAVDISGDGSRCIVGVDSDWGATYVFDRSATWQQSATLTAISQSEGDNFGAAVALSDAGDIVLVGAEHADGPAGGSGTGYIFTESAGVWSLTTQLQVPYETTTSQRWGQQVALSANGAVAILASRLADVAASNSGGLLLYTSAAGVWGAVDGAICGSDAASNNYFGSAVAISADGKIAASGATPSTSSGAVYVYG